MLHPTAAPADLRRRRVIVAATAGVLLLIAAVTYAVLVDRSPLPTPAPTTTANGMAGDPPVETNTVITEIPALKPTSDPETFARLVAEAIFAWDTTTLITRTDHVDQLLAVADPTGESSPGLVADLDNYLPTQAAWVELATYETRQWLTIDSTTTPTSWAEAQAQAGDRLLPGTTAYTITGTRNRAGVWESEPVSSAHQVAFTVFIVCKPSYPQCRLLRLSRLDEPLN
ncbi:hypothetical protein GCM10027062_30450 [Nocardioides hungaricus]|jgi:hypothetical protein